MTLPKDATTMTLAKLLLSEIEDALRSGTKHYHPVTDKLLTNPKEIIDCLLKYGTITFVPQQEHIDA